MIKSPNFSHAVTPQVKFNDQDVGIFIFSSEEGSDSFDRDNGESGLVVWTHFSANFSGEDGEVCPSLDFVQCVLDSVEGLDESDTVFLYDEEHGIIAHAILYCLSVYFGYKPCDALFYASELYPEFPNATLLVSLFETAMGLEEFSILREYENYQATGFILNSQGKRIENEWDY